jgi:hypothetical protein
MLLHRDGQSVWRDATDSGSEIDVAVIWIERAALPQHCVLEAFTPTHLSTVRDNIEVGTALLVVGFPLASTTCCTPCRWCATRSSPPPTACVSRARATS